MSLINCPECGKQISDRASSCPNCGCPIENMRSIPKVINTFDDVFEGGLVSKINPGSAKKAKKMIMSDENVLFASNLNIAVMPIHGKLSDNFSVKGKINGVFVVTDKRIIFVQSVLGTGDTKQIRKEDISSIDTKTSIMNCPIRIKGITEMFVIDCNNKIQRKILEAISKN